MKFSLKSLLPPLAAGALLFGAPLAQAEPLGVDPLRIELDTQSSRPLPKSKSDRAKYNAGWQKACEQLAKAMSIGKGPYGFGIFSGYSCYQGSKLVGGDNHASKWSLTVSDGKKTVHLKLAYHSGKASITVAELKLPPSEFTMQFFKDDEFVDLVSYALLGDGPAGMLVSKAQTKGNPATLTTRYWRAGTARDFKYTVPDPPDNLVLYRLAWDGERNEWRSEVVGTAKLEKVTEPKRKKKGKKPVMVGGTVEYQLSPEAAAALASGPLWAHNANGPGSQKTELDETLEDAQLSLDAAAQSGKLAQFMNGKQDLLASLLDSAASGYVGLRYGREVLPGSGGLGDLLKKTSVFGLLVEIRGGPAKGLRYYYDVMPKASSPEAGTNGPVNTSIAFSRHVLAYSFEFDTKYLVDRVTVDPKIGIWTFNATLPVALDANGAVAQTADFNLGRTFSLGIELGLEDFSDWYTLRAWYGINTGYSLIKTGGKVTSNRFGIDAYFTGGPVLPFFGVPLKTALLAFYYFEAVDLSAGHTSDPAPGQSIISGVSYDVGYAGLGVALSW